MSGRGRLRGPGRRGGTSPAVLLLLAGILVALVVLISVLVTQRGDGAPGSASTERPEAGATPAVADGQQVRRSELPAPPKPPEPIADPDRIKETLRAGATYHVVIKAGLDARATDRAWWRKEVIHVAYLAEMAIDRTIEANDGKRVVELRRFVAARNVKLLCTVEDAAIDLGAPGALLLGALAYLRPDAGAAVVAAKPIADAILRIGAQEAAKDQATRAVAHVDSLAGKAVRITYVDGVGVEAIEPVGCTLTAEERDFVFGTAALSDCYLWDLKKAVGQRWAVDGSQLAGLLDPSLRGTAEGEVGLIRDADGGEGGKAYAALRIEGGTLTIDASDASRRRIGSFTPRGTLRFSLADKVVEAATLGGRFDLEEVSTDHILFETSFRARPTLTVEYACSIRR